MDFEYIPFGNAYYAITSPAMLASPEWPAAYRNYSLFVVFDSITPANLTRMRRDIPHARFLIYHAYASVVTGGGRCSGCAGAACSHPDRPPPAFFQKEWAITDLRTKQPMCLGGWRPFLPFRWCLCGVGSVVLTGQPLLAASSPI